MYKKGIYLKKPAQIIYIPIQYPVPRRVVFWDKMPKRVVATTGQVSVIIVYFCGVQVVIQVIRYYVWVVYCLPNFAKHLARSFFFGTVQLIIRCSQIIRSVSSRSSQSQWIAVGQYILCCYSQREMRRWQTDFEWLLLYRLPHSRPNNSKKVTKTLGCDIVLSPLQIARSSATAL